MQGRAGAGLSLHFARRSRDAEDGLMKWNRLLRLFGPQRAKVSSPRDKRRHKLSRRPSLELLERRELLNGQAPTITAVVPQDGSTLNIGHPTIQITFSEDVIATEAQDTA